MTTQPTPASRVAPISLEHEMRQSYLDYAMSVIVSRALPDVRDGLKPVHRRLLHAMNELRNHHDKPYKKSARVVGDVIGKYHPHGDSAVYGTLVRMAQPFSMRYLMVDGQGNFGSVDGDAPAAMRYTEVRLARITHEMLSDLDRDTVDFQPNYDGNEEEPQVLPARIPLLLANGSDGIAVGMASHIPPHNLGEVVRACIEVIDNEEVTLDELMEIIPGPDFPTRGLIGRPGIRAAYQTGRGKVVMRARIEVETAASGRESLVVQELPYQVNKATLIENIAAQARDSRIEGIRTVRDESDKDGLRVVIELSKDAEPEVVRNNLYKHTHLRKNFSINMVALVDGHPEQLGLRTMLDRFLSHRRDVVTRRTLHDLREARNKVHRLEGFAVALANIDEVIALIRKAQDSATARAALVARPWEPGPVSALLAQQGAEASRPEDLPEECGLHEDGYHLSEFQAQAILDLRLHRLTGMEQEKIRSDYRETLEQIAQLRAILASEDLLMEVIRTELEEILEQYDDPRRTEIEDAEYDFEDEDLIPVEDRVVTLSGQGYVKSQPPDTYQAQRRGGRGKTAMSLKDEDYIEQIFIASSHDTTLCFTNLGRVYWLRVFQVPTSSRTTRGRPLANLLPLQPDEKVNMLMPVSCFDEERTVVMASRLGQIIRVSLSRFANPRPSGIIAVRMRDDDRLIGATLTDGNHDLLLVSSDGKAIRFAESEARKVQRGSLGVRGMHLRKGAEIISLISLPQGTDETGELLVATSNGYGKRTDLSEFHAQHRGGQGRIAIRTSERNGPVVGATITDPEQELLLITDGGILVRTRVGEVAKVGRNAQGVRLIRPGDGDHLTRIFCMDAEEGEDGEEEIVVH